MTNTKSARTTLMKGYLPVCFVVPPTELINTSTQTFLYLKEHFSNSNHADDNDPNNDIEEVPSGRTLFVANVPFYDGTRSSLLLRHILEKYGEVEHVIVVPSPRNRHGTKKEVVYDMKDTATERNGDKDASPSSSSINEQIFRERLTDTSIYVNDTIVRHHINPRFEYFFEGKFAHVIFTSPKEMKRALRQLSLCSENNNQCDNMKRSRQNDRGADASSSSDSDSDSDSDSSDNEKDRYDNAKKKVDYGNVHKISITSLELSELQEASLKMYNNYIHCKLSQMANQSAEETDNTTHFNYQNSNDVNNIKNKSIHALLEEHKICTQLHNPSKSMLLETCNSIMSKYDQEEEETIRKQKEASSQPDADGFVTITHGAVLGDRLHMEKDGTLGHSGGSGYSRISTTMQMAKAKATHQQPQSNTSLSKKRKIKGSEPLQDFYRFQMKERQIKSANDLKRRFEEDLKKVQEMKEQNKFRAF